MKYAFAALSSMAESEGKLNYGLAVCLTVCIHSNVIVYRVQLLRIRV